MTTEEFIFEKISYREDSSLETVEAIRNRVSILEEGIILLNEIPIVSPFSINLVFDQMKIFAKTIERCAYLIDITKTEIPNAETRRVINAEFQSTLSNVKHVSFVTGKNFIINTAARFVMYQTNLNSFTIDKTREKGIESINKVHRGNV